VKSDRSLLSLPHSVDLNFQNVGNTHLVPRGIVKVFDPSGKTVSQGTINESSSIILPQARRLYTTPLRSLISISKPGKYKIEVDFRFDGIDQVRAYQSSFWYISLPWLISIILLIGIVAYIVFRVLTRRSTKNKQST
jgi:hypothetical protein